MIYFLAETEAAEWGAESSLPVAGMPDLDGAAAPGTWTAYDVKADASWA